MCAHNYFNIFKVGNGCTNRKNKAYISFLGFMESNYTLIQIYDFTKNYSDYIGVNIKRLIIAMGITEIFSFVSIIALFFLLLTKRPKGIKIMGIVSFVLCSTMFFIFTSSIHMLNSSISEKLDNYVVQIVHATPWPYVMLICSAVLLFTSVFISAHSIEYVQNNPKV